MIAETLIFDHVYSSAPWGGAWIGALFGRTDVPPICSESWEISGHPFGLSTVTQGTYAGKTLAQLVELYGADLVGKKASDVSRFPLLCKLLDARRSLSVQVHPNVQNAAKTLGEAKTEAWIVLAAAPGAALYAGVAPHTTAETFREAVAQGEALVGVLKRHPVKAGDILYIPGGVVHAIGAGCLIYEVQQASNTTYRFYDWDRVDANGVGRPLHIREAFASLDFAFPPVRVHRARLEKRVGDNVWHMCVRSPYFTVRQLELANSVTMPGTGESFIGLFVLEGGVKVQTEAGGVSVMRGGSALIPACAQEVTFKAHIAGTRLLVVTL